jgi:glycosyltransferase involved in cell wall biosynthesis
MSVPLFSVAVVTYNQEQYIEQTLNSILEQKHDYPYEIVVGEDCSTDNTRQILLKYKKRYPDIIILLLNERNLGLVENYFNVMRHCSGKYILQCAGDDYWLPGKVALQIDFMEKNPEYGMSYGKVKNFLQNQEKYVKIYTGDKHHSFLELIYGNTIPALSVCMKRDLLERYVLEINPLSKNWLMEDYPIWLWFSQNSNIHFINKIIGVYRTLNESASNTKNHDKRNRFNISEREVRKFFLKKYSVDYQYYELQGKYREIIDSALKTGNYSLYRENIFKIEYHGFRIFVKKIIGGSYFLFLLYRYYLRRKGVIHNSY